MTRFLIYTTTLITALTLIQANIIIKQITSLYDSYRPEVFVVKPKQQVKQSIEKMIALKAIENDLNPKYLVKLAKCESSLNPTIQSKFQQSYGLEQSFGLFQIHLKAHPHISVEQAIDPEFNTLWAIEQIKKGKAPRYWVHCHKVAKGI